MDMLLTCTLYYDARPGYLISSIRTVCEYRKCSFLTGLITSVTDLLQAYQKQEKRKTKQKIGKSKTKSTGSPVPAPIALLSEFFYFALAEIFSSSPGACSQTMLLFPALLNRFLTCTMEGYIIVHNQYI